MGKKWQMADAYLRLCSTEREGGRDPEVKARYNHCINNPTKFVSYV